MQCSGHKASSVHTRTPRQLACEPSPVAQGIPPTARFLIESLSCGRASAACTALLAAYQLLRVWEREPLNEEFVHFHFRGREALLHHVDVGGGRAVHGMMS